MINLLCFESPQFQKKNLRYNCHELIPNGNNDVLFGNIIRSDGLSVDCLFYKKLKNTNSSSELQLEHFNFEEIQTSYNPLYIDPGRKSVSTAANGLNKDAHSVLRCSTKEYYRYTGSMKFSAEQRKCKKIINIESIESDPLSTKITSSDEYKRYIEYMLRFLDTLFNFYNSKTDKYRFFLHQERQRAPEILISVFINGASKYNKKKRKYKNRKKKRGRRKKKKVVSGGKECDISAKQ